MQLRWKEVSSLTKEKTALVIPNGSNNGDNMAIKTFSFVSAFIWFFYWRRQPFRFARKRRSTFSARSAPEIRPSECAGGQTRRAFHYLQFHIEIFLRLFLLNSIFFSPVDYFVQCRPVPHLAAGAPRSGENERPELIKFNCTRISLGNFFICYPTRKKKKINRTFESNWLEFRIFILCASLWKVPPSVQTADYEIRLWHGR